MVWTDRTLVLYEKQESLSKTLGYSCCLCLDRYRDVGYIVKVGDSKGCLI